MIKNSNRQTSNNQSQKEVYKNNPTFGIYIGEVVGTTDKSHQGKVAVYIPTLSQTNPLGPDAEKKDESTGFFTCTWGQTFAGSTQEDPADESAENPESYVGSRKSYGMWTPPPDIGTTVLVCFGNGNMKYPFVISSLFPNVFTYMVPGMPSGVSWSDPALFMPVSEKNMHDGSESHNNALRPVHVDIAEGIVRQGLINDPLRGSGSSGSRRESPSEVFGILTPGPKDPDNPKNRIGGHQFVMDDNVDSRLIRLRTAGGSQLLLDDTTGVIYMINKKGTAWVELGTNGDINFFGEGSMNFRTKGNFNLRADKNVNIEAGQNVNIKAAGDNVAGNYVGLPSGFTGPQGTGGIINMESTSNINQLAGQNVLVTAGAGEINLNSAGQTTVQAGSTFAVNAIGDLVLVSAKGHAGLHGAGSVSATSRGVADFYGSILTLNSAPGVAARERTGTSVLAAMSSSKTSPAISINTHQDAAPESPRFNRKSALDGKTAATTFGERVGSRDRIKTIVPVLLTAEPYIGHYSYDPAAAMSRRVPKSEQKPSQDIIDALPVGVNPNNLSKPADVNTPQGFMAGVNYSDASGNVLDTALGGAIPKYDSRSIKNNFEIAQKIRLLEINSLDSVIAAMQTAIPILRFPTITAAGQTIIGVMKQINEVEAQLRQFAVNAIGEAEELLNGAIGEMQNTISAIAQTANSVTEQAMKFAEAGITVIKDGASTIFKDKQGNMLVDFSNGIGPVGSSLGLIADLQGSFNNVKSAITVPISANQAMAIASFAQSVGEENFMSSNVLTAINKEMYGDIPRLMSGWVLSPDLPGGQQLRQPDLVDRRAWEASLFQNPDEVPTSLITANTAPGEMNFKQLAQNLDLAREEFLSQ